MELMYAIIIFFLGVTLSSFYQVVATRLPKKETLMGRSMCDHCHQTLRAIDIIPIIGFLINRGKCHFCKEKISFKYLIFELIGGALFVLSYLLLGFSLELIVAIVLVSVLFIETISDLEYHEVIDIVWIIGFILILIVRIIQGEILAYLLSSAVLFLGLFLLGYGTAKLLKKETLGGGDIKLYLFIGIALKLPLGLLTLFFASFIALIYAIVFKKTKEYIPLVPFISIAVLIIYSYGAEFITWYLGLFGM